MPRRVPLKPRQKKQGLNFVIKYLRSVIEDDNTPAWLRVVCIDRLAIIDSCYEVNLLPVNHKIQRPPRINEPTADPEEEQEVEQLEDKEGKAILDSFNAKFFNTGRKNA